MAIQERSYREMLEGMSDDVLAFELLKLENEMSLASQELARLPDGFGELVDVMGERFAPAASAAAHARWIAIQEGLAA